MTAVFISYSRRDQAFVKGLHDALSARDYDVWVDWEDIPPSAEWAAEIRTGVGSADGFIYVISPDSASSEVCRRELDHAVEQRKRIVPILHRDPGAAKVPDAAAELNWIFLRDGDNFEAGLEQLIAALETDLDHVRTHTRLGVAAGRWQAGGRDRSLLLRGADLGAAEAWLVAGAGKQPEATQLQREYVLASRQGATRRQRTVIGAVTVALAVAIVLAVVALIQRASAIHERNVAQARQLDAQAQNQYSKDSELSVLLAAKGAQIAPGTATEEALRQALGQSHVRVRYGLGQVAPGDALWSPDGKRLLVTSPQLWARIYAPMSGAAPVTLPGPGPSSRAESAWDARGDRVVLGGVHAAVYDALTGRLVARLPGSAIHAALTRDGSRAVTVDVNSVGHVFDVATGRELASFRPRYQGGTTCFALSPTDAVVAQCDASAAAFTGNGLSALDTWDLATGRRLHSIEIPSLIETVAFSPDGRRYVFTSPAPAPGGARASKAALARAEGLPGTFVRDTASGRPVIEFPGAASEAAFSPSRDFPALAYATLDDIVHIYDFASGVSHTLIGSTDTLNSLRFSSGGAYLVAGSRDNTARVYTADLGGLPIEVLAGHGAPVRDAGFGLADTSIATASEDGYVLVWNTPIPRPLVSLAPPAAAPTQDAFAASASFTADSARIVEASQNGQGRVLAARDLHLLATFAAPPGQGFDGAAASRDGRVVAALSAPIEHSSLGAANTLGPSHAAEIYDARTGSLIKSISSVPALLNGALDYTGAKLVTVDAGGGAEVWNAGTGGLLHALAGSGAAGAAAFSKDGAQLAVVHYPPVVPPVVTATTTFGNVTVDIWDAQSGRRERTITVGQLNPEEALTAMYAPLTVAFSPDGRLLAVSGADSAVRVFDPETGKLASPKPLGILNAPGGSWVDSLAFSPDGKLLAAGAISGAYMWRIPSYLPFPTFQHVAQGAAPPFIGAGFGVQVGFTEDSQYLMTSGDLTLEAWDPVSNLQLFKAYPSVRGSLSPDGRELVSAGARGLAVYPCELCGGLSRLLSVAKLHTTRQLRKSERATFLSQG